MSRLSHWLRERNLHPAQWSAAPADPKGLIGRHRLAPPLTCDVEIGAAEKSALFARVAAAWKTLGDADPYWSVLTQPEYRAGRIADHEDSFYDPQSSGAAAFKALFARNGEDTASIRTCVELGCGVGRTTSALARLIPSVIGLDISAPHLRLAAAHFAKHDIRNVELRQLTSIDDLGALPEFDLFFSEIVLQHNPPPIMAAMLEHLFAKIRPGGYCLFQVPTYQQGYRFEAAAYISQPREPERLEQNMEMHILPQRVVFRLMRDAGIDPIEVVEDSLTGDPSFQSTTFFGRKRRSD